MKACETGDLEVIRQLYESYPTINISLNNNNAFLLACQNGHLKVVRQLYEWKPTINILARDDWAFISACQNGHLEVVRQLLEWNPTIDISAYDDSAFIMACKNGHLEVVKQLYEWKPTIISKYIFNQYRSLFLSLGITLPIPDTLTKEFIPKGETLQCPICMDIIQNECLVTKCGHKYCGKCIHQWLEKNSSCPFCRASI
jgi:ankyrin repeat protein